MTRADLRIDFGSGFLDSLRAKARLLTGPGRERQLAFDPWPEARLDASTYIERVLVLDVKESGLSREEICERISRLTGRPFAVSTLDSITAGSHPHRIHADLVGPWCVATGSMRLLELLAATAGAYLMDERERKLADLAAAELESRRLLVRKRKLRAVLESE